MRHVFALLLLCLWPAISGTHSGSAAWGFYGHRMINRMAVFTLPSGMIGPFKLNIDYLSDHAVDPDKRRYATRHEAARHFIDLDQWGTYPFETLPRRWTEVLAASMELYCTDGGTDTTWVLRPVIHALSDTQDLATREAFVREQMLPQYYEDTWSFDADSVTAYFPDAGRDSCDRIAGVERFSEHGILPYHLYSMQQQLTRAFARKELPSVLRISADFGHYLADAHVPLHTARNYNGQLTGQDGIHAFWESRIPELFAESNWDFLVGQAQYIRSPLTYFWDIVLESHRLVDEVLRIEKELAASWPEDQQYCFDERLQVVVRTQCAEYARAFHERMDGMVEKRMRDAILAVGSAWFTAWVDGGQPVFGEVVHTLGEEDRTAMLELERAFIKGRIFGRKHE